MAWHWGRPVVLSVLCLSLLEMMSIAKADTVAVGTGCTLDNAVDYFNSGKQVNHKAGCSVTSGTTDTITLPAGNYALTRTLTVHKSLAISGAGSQANTDGTLGSSETRIVAPANDRAFVFYPDPAAVSPPNSPPQLPGSSGGSATAIAVALSQLSIVGGVATDDCESVWNLVESPVVPSTSALAGGAICDAANLSLTNVQIRGAQARDLGGAIYVAQAGSLVTNNVAMMGNSVTSASGQGAAIFADAGRSPSNIGAIALAASSFHHQCDTQAAAPAKAPVSCAGGAGLFTVYIKSSVATTLANVTISTNQAAALYINSKATSTSPLLINNSTLVNNLAGYELEAPKDSSGNYNGSVAYLTNTIVAGNASGGVESDCLGSTAYAKSNVNASLGSAATYTGPDTLQSLYNLFSTDANCPVGSTLQAAPSTADYNSVDQYNNLIVDLNAHVLIAPAKYAVTDKGILSPLQNNGGSVWTHKPRLLIGSMTYSSRSDSPVVTHGHSPSPNATQSNTTDFTLCAASDARGFNRNGCDIGAAQYQYPSPGKVALTGTSGMPVTSLPLTTNLGDSDLLPGSQCANIYSDSKSNVSLAPLYNSTAPGCSWVVDSSLDASSFVRGTVVFNNDFTLTYTPSTAFHGAAVFNIRQTTTSSRFNSDPNDRFVTTNVIITEQPSSGWTSSTLSGGMGGWLMVLLLPVMWIRPRGVGLARKGE